MGIQEEHAVETYKSLMLYGSAGLKFVLIANGAAAIGILTFLGHYAARESSSLPDLRWPLAVLLAGVFLGGIGTATTYLTQLTLYNESIGGTVPKWMRTHSFWLHISIALILLGMLAFAVGVFWGVTRLPR